MLALASMKYILIKNQSKYKLKIIILTMTIFLFGHKPYYKSSGTRYVSSY